MGVGLAGEEEVEAVEQGTPAEGLMRVEVLTQQRHGP